MKRIDTITKSNTLLYIPNAILIICNDKSEFFFASFIDRDYCYNLLTNLTQVEKRVCEVAGPDSLIEPSHLMFGYQHRSTLISSSKMEESSVAAEEGDDLEISSSRLSLDGDYGNSSSSRTDEERQRSSTVGSDGNNSLQLPPLTSSSAVVSASPITTTTTTTLKNEESSAPGTDSKHAVRRPLPTVPPPEATPPPLPTKVIPPPPPKKKNPLPPPNIDAIYKTSGISLVSKKSIKGSATDVWQAYWRDSSGNK
jgi:hypothetical protein